MVLVCVRVGVLVLRSLLRIPFEKVKTCTLRYEYNLTNLILRIGYHSYHLN